MGSIDRNKTYIQGDTDHPKSGKHHDERVSDNFTTFNLVGDKIIWKCDSKLTFDIKEEHKTIFKNLRHGEETEIVFSKDLYIYNIRGVVGKFSIDAEGSGSNKIYVVGDINHKNNDSKHGYRVTDNFDTNKLVGDMIRIECDPAMIFDLREEKRLNNYTTIAQNLRNGTVISMIYSDALYIGNIHGTGEKFSVDFVGGMKSDILAGYTSPALVKQPFIDHTYVISSGGKAYACFGNDHGGLHICGGGSKEEEAAILDWAHNIAFDKKSNSMDGGKDLEGHAGIKYGWSGVCHQTANRILYPIHKDVRDAGGYSISSLLYGPYGSGDWKGDDYKPKNCKVESSFMGELYSEEYTFDLIKEKIGVGVFNSNKSVIEIAVKKLRQSKQSLDEKYIDKAIDLDYAYKVNSMVEEYLSELSTVLLDEDYKKLFNHSKEDPKIFLDIEKFKEEHSLNEYEN